MTSKERMTPPHHYFHHSPHLVTPRYTIRSGFKIQGIKPIVDDGPGYWALEEMETTIQPDVGHPERNLRHKTYTKFLSRNRVLSVFSHTISQLYYRYSQMRPHRRPIEFFLEYLAELNSQDPEAEQLDKEIDELAEAVMQIRDDCLKLQWKLKTWGSEPVRIYHEYLISESETDDKVDSEQRRPGSTPVNTERTSYLDRWEIEEPKASQVSRSSPPVPVHREVSFSINTGKPSFIQAVSGEFRESLASLMEE